jgi:hypothetical protein
LFASICYTNGGADKKREYDEMKIKTKKVEMFALLYAQEESGISFQKL